MYKYNKFVRMLRTLHRSDFAVSQFSNLLQHQDLCLVGELNNVGKNKSNEKHMDKQKWNFNGQGPGPKYKNKTTLNRTLLKSPSYNIIIHPSERISPTHRTSRKVFSLSGMLIFPPTKHF